MPVTAIAEGLPEAAESVVLTIQPVEAYAVESGEAVVSIKDNGTPSPTLSMRILVDRSLEISLIAQAGRRYVLERSTDLRMRTPVRTNLLFTNPLVFELPPGSNDARPYFRATSP